MLTNESRDRFIIVIIIGIAVGALMSMAGATIMVGKMSVSKPKTSIKTCSSLPKDMIDIAQSGAKGGTLEVVEKSGLRKATLYLPIPGGVNPSP